MYLTVDQVEKLIKQLDQDTKALKEDLFRMCWFMRGGLSYPQALDLTNEEREIISKVINSNLEVAKETQMPFF